MTSHLIAFTVESHLFSIVRNSEVSSKLPLIKQECPFKSVSQECSVKSVRVSSKSVQQECPPRVSSKNVQQECVSSKSVKKECREANLAGNQFRVWAEQSWPTFEARQWQKERILDLWEANWHALAKFAKSNFTSFCGKACILHWNSLRRAAKQDFCAKHESRLWAHAKTSRTAYKLKDQGSTQRDNIWRAACFRQIVRIVRSNCLNVFALDVFCWLEQLASKRSSKLMIFCNVCSFFDCLERVSSKEHQASVQ